MTDEQNKDILTEENQEKPKEENAQSPDGSAHAETCEKSAENEKEAKKKQRHAEAEIADLKRKLEKMQTDLNEQNDRCLRIAAEYDNFRKRTAKEKENVYTDAYGDALQALLPVIDNLERAAQYAEGENVTKGVALTLKSAKEALQKLGVQEIEALGKPFDPKLHEAVLHIEDETMGEGVVAEVLQKGYCRGDRVLRYATVKVAN